MLKANVDHTIIVQGTAVSTLDHSATTPRSYKVTPHTYVLQKDAYFSEMVCTAVSLIAVVNSRDSTCVWNLKKFSISRNSECTMCCYAKFPTPRLYVTNMKSCLTHIHSQPYNLKLGLQRSQQQSSSSRCKTSFH